MKKVVAYQQSLLRDPKVFPMTRRNRQIADPLDEPSVEEEVLLALGEFTRVLEADEVGRRLTCRQIS